MSARRARELVPSRDRIVTGVAIKGNDLIPWGETNFLLGWGTGTRLKCVPFLIPYKIFADIRHTHFSTSLLSPLDFRLELQVFLLPILRLTYKNDAYWRRSHYFVSPTCYSSWAA